MTQQSQQQEKQELKKLKRYSVREVLDSLYFSEVDHDDDFDGFIHLTSTIDGSGTKIEMGKLSIISQVASKEYERGKSEERRRVLEEVLKNLGLCVPSSERGEAVNMERIRLKKLIEQKIKE